MDNEWKMEVGDRAGLGVIWAAGLAGPRKALLYDSDSDSDSDRRRRAWAGTCANGPSLLLLLFFPSGGSYSGSIDGSSG